MAFPSYKNLNLVAVSKDIQTYWENALTFEASMSTREGRPPYIFFEGPPSANGLPGYSPRDGTRNQRHFLSL
jgi:isoleucyl-tRNA synthetase